VGSNFSSCIRLISWERIHFMTSNFYFLEINSISRERLFIFHGLKFSFGGEKKKSLTQTGEFIFVVRNFCFIEKKIHFVVVIFILWLKILICYKIFIFWLTSDKCKGRIRSHRGASICWPVIPVVGPISSRVQIQYVTIRNMQSKLMCQIQVTEKFAD
jgi:hypothetical protein